MARPRKYATDAERRAAHLAKQDRFDLVTSQFIGGTVRELAELFHASNNEVLNDLIRFALTNRDWKRQGLLWSSSKKDK